MRKATLWIAVTACLLACGEQPGLPTYAGPTLPALCYGTWELAGSSGGIGGGGFDLPAGPRPRLVIARDGTLTHVKPSGERVTLRFEARHDRTIFSTEPLWMLAFVDGELDQVVQKVTADELVLSENVHDGFARSYRRVSTR